MREVRADDNLQLPRVHQFSGGRMRAHVHGARMHAVIVDSSLYNHLCAAHADAQICAYACMFARTLTHALTITSHIHPH
eukprot:3728209-Pleurochrysis_carterae.AAC.1